MKLWKVKVNNWGCDTPKTIYAKTREDAEKIAAEYPAAGAVEYAGNFADLKAEWLLADSGWSFEAWLSEREDA